MSQQESNICEICGGPLQANHLWCPGPHSEDEPTPKHDGKLDKDGWSDVEITEIWSCVQDKYGQGVRVGSLGCENESMRVELDPAQALSLLAWLSQEKNELERLAKEQE